MVGQENVCVCVCKSVCVNHMHGGCVPVKASPDVWYCEVVSLESEGDFHKKHTLA